MQQISDMIAATTVTRMPDTISVRLPRWLIDEVRPMADAYRRTLTAQLIIALEAHIRAEGAEARHILAERGQQWTGDND
jgi:hypothetical protein